MRAINRIVVAIDFSIYSAQILEYAAGVAWQTSAEIIAVTVVNKRFVEAVEKAYNVEHPGAFIQKKFLNDEKDRRAKNLENLVQEWVPEQVNTRIHIRSGIPFREIIKVVTEEDADLLIIAPQGRTNLPEYLFGSTSKKIFRHSPVTVLSLNVKRVQQYW